MNFDLMINQMRLLPTHERLLSEHAIMGDWGTSGEMSMTGVHLFFCLHFLLLKLLTHILFVISTIIAVMIGKPAAIAPMHFGDPVP